jgi:hypothetical protein
MQMPCPLMICKYLSNEALQSDSAVWFDGLWFAGDGFLATGLVGMAKKRHLPG